MIKIEDADSAKPARPKRGAKRASGKGRRTQASAAPRDLIASAAIKLGGVDRLVAWAQLDAKNEAVFWGSLYPKLIPLQLSGEDGGAVEHGVTVKFV